MDRIYQIPIGSALLTDGILKLDSVRDQTGHAIDIAVEAQLKSPDLEMVAAARELAQTKVSFPVDPRAGYLSQTSQLDTYIAVMLGAQVENTTKVGVLPLVQNLKAVNDQIHALINLRGEENVAKGQDLSRPEARQQAIDAWRIMLKYVNGYNLVILGATGAVEALDIYIDTINDIGDRYRRIYLNSAGTKPDGSPADTPTETPDPEGGSDENTGSGEGGDDENENGSGEGDDDEGTLLPPGPTEWDDEL